jgi:hypothetical protein
MENMAIAQIYQIRLVKKGAMLVNQYYTNIFVRFPLPPTLLFDVARFWVSLDEEQ